MESTIAGTDQVRLEAIWRATINKLKEVVREYEVTQHELHVAGNFFDRLGKVAMCRSARWLEGQSALQIEFLKAENRALRSRLGWKRILFTDAERLRRILKDHLIEPAPMRGRHIPSSVFLKAH